MSGAENIQRAQSLFKKIYWLILEPPHPQSADVAKAIVDKTAGVMSGHKSWHQIVPGAIVFFTTTHEK